MIGNINNKNRMSVKFINLSSEKSKGLNELIYQNAVRLKNDATYLAKDKNSYSTATSLLILSLEETIKSLIVFLHSEGYPIYKSKRISKIFSHHKTRHDFAIFIETINAIFILSTVCRKGFENRKKQSEELKSKSLNSEDLLKGFGILWELIESIFNDKIIKNFDDYKNNGLYVDYIDRLFIPEKEITDGHYEQVQQVLNTITKIYKLILIAHNSKAQNRNNYILYEDIKKQIEEIIKNKHLDDYLDSLKNNINDVD